MKKASVQSLLVIMFISVSFLFSFTAFGGCGTTQQTINQICDVNTGICNSVQTVCLQFEIPEACEIALSICGYSEAICELIQINPKLDLEKTHNELVKVQRLLSFYDLEKVDNAYQVQAKLKEANEKMKEIYTSLK